MSATHRGIGSYQKTETLGKSPLELLLMVYNGATQALSEAAEAFDTDDWTVGREKLERADKFITHLYTTLDMEKGGEVAKNLATLYTFVIEQIRIAEATRDSNLVRSLIVILNNLKSGWSELGKSSADPAGSTSAMSA